MSQSDLYLAFSHAGTAGEYCTPQPRGFGGFREHPVGQTGMSDWLEATPCAVKDLGESKQVWKSACPRLKGGATGPDRFSCEKHPVSERPRVDEFDLLVELILQELQQRTVHEIAFSSKNRQVRQGKLDMELEKLLQAYSREHSEATKGKALLKGAIHDQPEAAAVHDKESLDAETSNYLFRSRMQRKKMKIRRRIVGRPDRLDDL